MGEDRLFRDKRSGSFSFGAETAAVFDNMLDRSVPFYGEIQRMICEIALDFAADATRVYDLGCSTGTTLLGLAELLPPAVDIVGVDSSAAMLDKCRAKLAESGHDGRCQLLLEDLNQGVAIENASAVILNLTLQFIRPLRREAIVRQIAAGLNANGCLILVEKVLGQSSTINCLFTKYYYEMKRRNGYSDMEIAQKREALENVLIPYRFEENQELLLRNGFTACDVFFRWYNFCGMLAVKQAG